MLLSLMFELRNLQRAPVLSPLGRPAQAWFLDWLSLIRPSLGKALHDQGGIKPYTISSIIDQHGWPVRTGSWLEANQTVWLRLTTYGEEVSQLMSDVLAGTAKVGRRRFRIPSHIHLYNLDFFLEGYTLSPAQHRWAGESTYSKLKQDSQVSLRRRDPEGSNSIRLEFVSPTAFRSQGADVPLPYPASLMRSWRERWNAYVPENLLIPDRWLSFAADCIVVSELININTERWAFAEGLHGIANGFTGIVGLTLRPRRLCPNHFAEWQGAQEVMQTLAAFSFYCGTGHHTTIGLGQTRSLPPAR